MPAFHETPHAANEHNQLPDRQLQAAGAPRNSAQLASRYPGKRAVGRKARAFDARQGGLTGWKACPTYFFKGLLSGGGSDPKDQGLGDTAPPPGGGFALSGFDSFNRLGGGAALAFGGDSV